MATEGPNFIEIWTPISIIFGLGTNEVSQRYTIHEVPNLENGPEEFWKSAESSPGAPIQNMGFGN